MEMNNTTISLTKRRLCLVILLSMIAGIPIGQYIGSTNQLSSDETHIINYADEGRLLSVRGHTYNITEINFYNGIDSNIGEIKSYPINDR